MSHIIQWNCRGLKTNFIEISLLVQAFLPVALCLQETHLKETDQINLNNYSLYSTCVKENERAAGGSSIFVRNNIIHSKIDLHTNLQAVAVRISLGKTITLCSLYIPPNSVLEQNSLKTLIDQLPSPFIIMGDFNAHNPIWGSSSLNNKGKNVEDLLNKEGLCIFNDGSNTYLHPGNGSYSAIDLTICDPSLLLDFSWRVHDDLCGSDHFPIILQNLFPSGSGKVPRYKFDKANWPLFEQLCTEELRTEVFQRILDPVLKFNETLISIADRTIPKTSANPKQPSKPWFDDDCEEARDNRKKAERHFNKHPTSDNLNSFRIFRAKARRTFKQRRRLSWQNFVSKLDSHTPMNKVWNFIQKIKGKNRNVNLHHLKEGHDILTSEEDISQKLAETFSKHSSSTNYSPQFQNIKNQKKRKN